MRRSLPRLARQSRPRQSLPRSCRATRSAKSPLRFVCLGAAVLALLAGLLKTVTNLRGFASVGVIGGADGPTEIFIAGPQVFEWADVIAAGIVLVLGLIGYLLLRRLPPKKG